MYQKLLNLILQQLYKYQDFILKFHLQIKLTVDNFKLLNLQHQSHFVKIYPIITIILHFILQLKFQDLCI